MTVTRKVINRLLSPLDKFYINADKKNIRRTRNIRLIPDYKFRKGGKLSYAEWAHVIGIFQTIIYQNLNKKSGNRILDIGCGTGLMGIASEPYLFGGGKYIGLDVVQSDVNFCRKNYKESYFDFRHVDAHNAMYADNQANVLRNWELDSASFDMATALSVWTHFNESHSVFYMKEVARVLKKGGRAIITFFYLDEIYMDSLNDRIDNPGRFHLTNQKEWVFKNPAYNSTEWYCPSWVKVPEDAIGITKEALKKMTDESGLKVVQYYPGNWKEIPGVFFQDIIIFEKE